MENNQDAEMEYKKALIAAKEHIIRLQEEKRTLQEVHEEFKQHYEKLNKDYTELGRKLTELLIEKKNSDDAYENNAKHYRTILAQREKAIQELQSKTFVPGDTDVLRTKVARDLENMYRSKLETLSQENEKLENELAESKRILAVTKTELEGHKRDYEKQLMTYKEKNTSIVNDMTEEIKALQKTGDSGPDKEKVRALKRELTEAQRKLGEFEKEMAEVKKERDALKYERDTAHFEKSKVAGQGELVKVTCDYEIERFANKLQIMQDDLNEEINRGKEKQSRIEQLTFELDSLRKKLAETNLELTSSKRKITELEDALKDREAELNTQIKRARQEEKENYLLEREEKLKLQQNIDKLEAGMMQITETAKLEKLEFMRQIQGLEQDKKNNQDEIKNLRKKITELQAANEAIKENYMKSMDKCDLLEKELAKLQEKHRNLLSTEQAHVTVKDKLELAVKNAEEEIKKLAEEKLAWNKERKDLQAQLVNLTQQYEKTTKDAADTLKHYKIKAKEYKEKVKQANIKLSSMANKLSSIHIENIPPSYQNLPPRPKYATYAADIKKPGIAEEMRQEIQETQNEIAKTLDKHKQIASKMGLQ